MKKTVLDINDLQTMAPFFKSKFGTWLGKRLIKWLAVDKVNTIHSRNCDVTGAAFTRRLLEDPLIDLKYRLHNEALLDGLPEGAFVTVSNHPIGSLDGIMLIDIFASRRPDFKVMVNGVLTKISAMGENFISVMPDSNRQGANPKNMNGVRLSLERLREGHPIGFFPAGAISFYDKKTKRVCDHPWTHSIIRLVRKANAPVYPVYFDFLNTRFFYWLGNVNWKIRVLRIPTEAFNKRGRTVDVYIGAPIPPETIRSITNDDELATFLYQKTYGAKAL